MKNKKKRKDKKKKIKAKSQMLDFLVKSKSVYQIIAKTKAVYSQILMLRSAIILEILQPVCLTQMNNLNMKSNFLRKCKILRTLKRTIQPTPEPYSAKI